MNMYKYFFFKLNKKLTKIIIFKFLRILKNFTYNFIFKYYIYYF